MQLKNLALAASVAATAAAAPAADAAPQYFGVIAIHSTSAVHNAGFKAAQNGLFAGGNREQGASCARPEEQFATFYIQDGELNLYDKSATPQTIFVDASGMGQGIIGYTTGAQPTPKNASRKGWAVKDSHLQFNGKDLIACPGLEGSFGIYADAGVSNPAGNSNCISIAARVEGTTNPNGCLYTQQQ
ncbi:hypothetical protein BDV25DRAFT_146593 [Aspergillus avenaceus]|uniref:Cell wall protein PhiA n=1 Tax=Aspergillus avenaceus TaxID=36643 RepID=A0A5N6U917_ASPAV|nr:hypothetical protein BDV25DRAFT_146593 [Aspergillus avenaceus]